MNLHERYNKRNSVMEWDIYTSAEDAPSFKGVAIPSLPLSEPVELGHDREHRSKGFVAVEVDGVWSVEPVTISEYKNHTFTSAFLHVVCDEAKADGRLVYPIDKRMTRDDIQDAKYHTPNEDGTAWVFHHESVGERRDHELTMMAVIEGVLGVFGV